MQYFKSRVVRLLAVLFLVTFVTYAMVRILPGDPARSFLGFDAPQAQVDGLRERMGLNENVVSGYAHWVADVVRGDLGESYRTDQSVAEALKQRFPVSLELMIMAQLFALGVAIPVGVITAHRPGGVFDRIWSAFAFSMIAIPGFVLGLVLIYLFPVILGWLQVSGFTPFSEDPLANIKSLVLPTLTLGLLQLAVYSRILRSDMISTLQEDFVTMARAKGLRTRRILIGHALRPSSFSLLTVAALNVGQLISGAVVVEILFGLPGIGSLMVNAITGRDLVVLQGAMLFIVFAYVVVNLLADGLYSVLDPRVRHQANV